MTPLDYYFLLGLFVGVEAFNVSFRYETVWSSLCTGLYCGVFWLPLLICKALNL